MRTSQHREKGVKFEARPPFAVGAGGWVYDADGDKVLVCSLDFPDCKKFYAESKVDSDPFYICACGQPGQRMEEATPARCGLVMPTAPITLAIGTPVEWTSQSSAYTKTKRGIVVQVVAAGNTPELCGEVCGRLRLPGGTGFGGPRKHESYLVDVDGVAYWPRVVHLRVVKKESVETPTNHE